MKSEKLISIIIPFFILLILFLNCSKDNPTEPEKESEEVITEAITDIGGNWSGTTSQDESIEFDIKSQDNGVNKITSYEITIRFTNATVKKRSSGELGYVTKTNHDFIITLQGDPIFVIFGVFTSNTNCNGTFYCGQTKGIWTAIKQ